LFYFSYFSAYFLRPGKNNNSDKNGNESRADLVPQDPPNDVIEAPSREVPMVGRAAKIRFGTLGTGFDLARQAWPSEQQVFSSQTTDMSELFPNRPKVPEVGSPGHLPVGFLQGEYQVDVMVVDLMDDTSWIRSVERTAVLTRPKVVVAATSADTLLKADKSAKAKVLRKRMRALGYEVTYWFLRAHQHGAALVQDRLFTVFYQASDTMNGTNWPWPPPSTYGLTWVGAVVARPLVSNATTWM
jgi:hypothetical protein